jgi:hypothetical protein
MLHGVALHRSEHPIDRGAREQEKQVIYRIHAGNVYRILPNFYRPWILGYYVSRHVAEYSESREQRIVPSNASQYGRSPCWHRIHKKSAGRPDDTSPSKSIIAVPGNSGSGSERDMAFCMIAAEGLRRKASISGMDSGG